MRRDDERFAERLEAGFRLLAENEDYGDADDLEEEDVPAEEIGDEELEALLEETTGDTLSVR